MLNKIHNDFYCWRWENPINCADFAACRDLKNLECNKRHRKWPTPEQYKEEYGEEYSEDGAVYLQEKDSDKWNVYFWGAVYASCSDCKVVCACTPFGKPDKDWGPEA